MKLIIHPEYLKYEGIITDKITYFGQGGFIVGDGKRNVIKVFETEGTALNVKSFKVPNFINSIAYCYFRKSKAERSYMYALRLMQNGIGTPHPIAFAEERGILGISRSYYISEHLDADLTYRELTLDADYPDSENILKQFTQFCFLLHEKGIEFLDHSPGNTLIKQVSPGKYAFFLVDLNRMNFHNRPLTFDERMVNMQRLTHIERIIETMGREYSALYGRGFDEVYEKMVFYVTRFQAAFYRKKRLKKKLKFWKR